MLIESKYGTKTWLKKPYRLVYTLKPTGDHDQMLADELFEKYRPFVEYKEGVYTFTFQPEAFGYMKVSDFCKVHGLTRQWVYQNPDKYEWLTASRNIRFVK